MPMNFARRTTSWKPRRLHFLPELFDVHRTHLPERADIVSLPSIQNARWKTVRLRPEIDEIIKALQARFMRTLEVDLSVSEVIAAVLIEAVPSITARTSKS